MTHHVLSLVLLEEVFALLKQQEANGHTAMFMNNHSLLNFACVTFVTVVVFKFFIYHIPQDVSYEKRGLLDKCECSTANVFPSTDEYSNTNDSNNADSSKESGEPNLTPSPTSPTSPMHAPLKMNAGRTSLVVSGSFTDSKEASVLSSSLNHSSESTFNVGRQQRSVSLPATPQTENQSKGQGRFRAPSWDGKTEERLLASMGYSFAHRDQEEPKQQQYKEKVSSFQTDTVVPNDSLGSEYTTSVKKFNRAKGKSRRKHRKHPCLHSPEGEGMENMQMPVLSDTERKVMAAMIEQRRKARQENFKRWAMENNSA
jgi:hypothetical protein